MPSGLRVPLVAQRLGERARAGAAAGGGEPVARDESRRRATRSATRSAIVSKPPAPSCSSGGVRGAIAEVRGRAEWACGLEVHAEFPRSRYRHDRGQRLNPSAPALRRPSRIQPRARDTSRGSGHRRRARREPRSARNGTSGIAILRAFEPWRASSTSDGTQCGEEPDQERGDRRVRPSIAPSSRASLTSPIPSPAG